jgi:hypothetical protein
VQRLNGRPLCRQFFPLPIKQRLQQRHRCHLHVGVRVLFVGVEFVGSGCSIATDDFLGPPSSRDTCRIMREFGIFWKCKQQSKYQCCIMRCW